MFYQKILLFEVDPHWKNFLYSFEVQKTDLIYVGEIHFYQSTHFGLCFSLLDNRMIISRNIVFTNLENILKGDVVEINIETKDTKIFMYEKEKKVNIKNKKY